MTPEEQKAAQRNKGNGKAADAPPAVVAAGTAPLTPENDPALQALAGELAATGATVPSPVQDAKRPANRFMHNFPEISFRVAESGKTYDNTDGSKIKKIGAFVAISADGSFGINGNIYARLARGAKTVSAECTFVGTRNAPAIVPLDEEAKAEMTNFRRHVAEQYSLWRNGQPTQIKVSKVGVDLPGLDASELFAE